MAAAAVELLPMGLEEILRQCHSLHLGLSKYCPRPIYLVDYTCYKPPESCRVPLSTILKHARLIPFLDPQCLEFQVRVLERSGLGETTCVPRGLHCIPDQSMANARAEAELVIFSAMDALFKRTGIQPKDIDILIVNCGLFSPSPSLSAMVINKYKMRSNIKSFNLSGMGCSASLISVNLARDLLQVQANAYAVVVSTEILTPNWYTGNQRSMLIPNCLFRMGGSPSCSRTAAPIAAVQSTVWCMLCAPTVVLMIAPTAVFLRGRTPKEKSRLTIHGRIASTNTPCISRRLSSSSSYRRCLESIHN
ncbi:hypothetical protein AMTRI_Chr13g84250 [Amborella trichopoda]